MDEVEESSSRALECKLLLVNEEIKKAPTEVILRALNSCHEKMQCQTDVKSLQEDCDRVEASLFSLLGQLKLYDTSDVLNMYKELVDAVVQYEHTQGGPRLMSTEFESPPVADCSDVMKYFKMDYVKNADPLLIDRKTLGFSKDKCFDKINATLQKAEEMLASACDLRELSIEELFENDLRKLHNPIITPETVDDPTTEKKKMSKPSKAKKDKQMKKVISEQERNPATMTLEEDDEMKDDLLFHTHIQPTDLLRCLLDELSSRGLVLKAAEHKLGLIQRDPRACSPSSLFEKPVVIELLGPDVVESGSKKSNGTKTLKSGKSSEKSVKTTTILTPVNDAVDYQSLGFYMEKQLQKPVGIPAAGLVIESSEGSRDITKAFDAAWLNGKNEATERQFQQWVGLTAKRSELQQLPPITSLEQVPHVAELITNPFGSCSIVGDKGGSVSDATPQPEVEWEWLTSLPDHAITAEKIYQFIHSGEELRRSDLSALESEVDHPFINQNSILYGQVNLKQCLSQNLLQDLERGFPLHVSSNMKFVDLPFLIQNQSGDLNNPQCLQDSPLFLALQPVDRANPVSTDAEFADARRVLYGAHMSSLRLGVYFERNVTRALHLLGLGLNILLVDGCTREVADAEAENLCSVPTSVKNLSYLESSLPSIVPDSFHRAFMLSTIIKRCVFNSIPHGEESGGIDEGVPCHGHGPILIVCRIGELLDFQDILQRECDASSDSNSIMRLLPYYGDATDREVLRSYMLPENIYSSRSHCHIVLTHYEAFTQDLFYFKGINWYLMVVDSFWGILSNKIYRKVRNEIATVNCRHRIISCASLGHVSNKATSPDSVASSTVTDTADTACQSKTTLYPDISSTLSFLLPVMWSLLESQEQPYGKTIEGEFVMSVQTRRLCLQLLAALTVVHNASLDDLVTEHVLSAHSKSNSRASLPHEVKLFNDASEWLPWYIWDCVSLKVVDVEVQHQQLEGADSLQNDTRHISKKIIYTFDYSVKYTRFYSDMELDSEMKSVKLDTVGNPDSSLRKRVRKKPGPKGAVSLPTKETKSTITESRRSSSAIKGEGVVGVSVVEVKVKRPYNMAKRRAIKQGLLPPVSGGETRGRRGKRRNTKDFGIVRQVMADLVSKVAHDTEETTCEKDTVVDSKLEQCPPSNIDSVEVKEETEKSADGGDVGARMEVEPESVWEEIHSENIKIDVVAATTTSASEDKAELKCVNEKLKPLVVVSEHKGDKVVVSEYVIDQDNVNNENGDFHEHLEDDHTVDKKNEEEIHKDSVIKTENERQVGETVLPQPWSLYSSSLGDTTEDGALKRSAVEISATGCDIEKTDTSNAREIEETIVSSASSSVGDSSNGDIRLPPAKKPKLTYYQRKKEAEYEKALASGVLPPNMLKKQGKKSFDRDGTYLPLKLKVVAVKKYSPKEERERSLFGRGNRVQVVINFPGRQRFLGSFKTLAEAEKAYNAALAQRFTLLTTGKSGLTRLRLVGGGGADKNHQSLILQQAGVPKKKTSSTSNNIPEFCNDVDLVRKVHDEVLVHAVRDMLHPLLAVKSIPLGDWETDLTPVHSMHAPPAFAKLHGPGGFVAYIHTRSSCVLGKYYKDTINLSKKFGINDPIGIGHGLGGSLRFDHQVSSRCQERPGHVDIHLGDDTSIARQHADIRFNKQTNFFELCALHETATVFVQGMRVTRVSGYVTIDPQCVIQLGSRIFRFLYPTSSPHVSQGTKNLKSADQFQVQPHPLEYKKGLLNVLLSVVKLRRKGFSMEGYPSASAAAHFSSYPLSEVEQADVQSAFHECELAVEKALPSIVHSQADIVEGRGSNSSERKHFKTSANGGGNFANAPEEFVGVYKSTAKNKAILRNLQDVEAAADLERSSLLQTLSSTPVFESNHERQQQHKKRAKEGDECEQATETAVKKMKTMSNNDC